jgi:hypothetical protein
MGGLHPASGRLEGSGNLVVGQGCLPIERQSCVLATGALIRLTSANASGLAGAIHVMDDTWYFELEWPNSLAPRSYRVPADLASIDGYYEVRLVDSAATEPVIMSVDLAGRVFFQSAANGCTGNRKPRTV